MIRNFGTVIDDDAVRSLVLSTRLLGTREIMIVNHTDCGRAAEAHASTPGGWSGSWPRRRPASRTARGTRR
jgi:carbonic anhydrase